MNSNLPAVVQTAITEQGIDLSKVNLLLPTKTFGAVLGQFDKVLIETVEIDPNPNNGDVYEPGTKGKFALGKRPLNAISNAVGIVWDPKTTTILESTEKKSRAKATGAMRKPNGEILPATDEKTVDLEAIEEKLRITQEDYAKKGKRIYENGRPVDLPWANCGGDVGKQTHIDREVRKALIQYRLFKDERAMTGAKERVIRAFLAIKSTYTPAEISKPFAFPRVIMDTDKLLAVPEVRQAAIDRMMGTVGSIFGPGPAKAQLDQQAFDASPGKALPEPVEQTQAEEVDDFDAPVATENISSPLEMARQAMEEWMLSPVVQGSASAMVQIKKLLANENATIEQLHALNDKCRAYEQRKIREGVQT